VGLISVRYADWSTDVYEAFVDWVAPHWWLALVLTPGIEVIGAYLTHRWFYGSEGSGIPQVIAAMHAPRAENDTDCAQNYLPILGVSDVKRGLRHRVRPAVYRRGGPYSSQPGQDGYQLGESRGSSPTRGEAATVGRFWRFAA
jgi:hypothetical protein